MKILLIDSQGSFTSGLRASWERKGHEVTVTKTFEVELAVKADLIWQEWLDVEAIKLTNAGRRWSAKTVARCHRYEVESGFLDKINFDILDEIVFISPTWLQKAQEKYPNLRQTRTCVIPNGVDLDRFSFQEHDHGNVVGIVGIMRPLTRPETILEIANRYPDYTFRWGGLWADWMDRRYVKQWMAQKPDNLQCLGWIDDMPSFYEGIDFLLSTKATEAFGFHIAEAMCRGVKPLVFNGEGIRDHWPDWLIWESLEDLDKLFHGPYESKKYHRYVRRYSLSRMCKAIDELIAIKRPLVSLTMIAKNEENTIEAAVDSVRPYVDEVVIGVDDKSEDATLEIAKRVADVTYEFEFEDFAQARNLAIENSSGDWWMCIDAHEIFRNTNDWQTVEDEDGNKTEVFDPKDDFRGFVRGCPAPAIDCEILMDKDQHGVSALTFSFPRICRWWSRWTRGIHNIPNVGNGPRRRDWEMHHQRGAQAAKSRQTRDSQRGTLNLFTLRQDIKKNPQDARAFFYLGNTARELNEWTYALWCYMEQLKFDKWREQRFWGRIYSAQCLLQLGRPLEAKEMILASLHDDPVRAEPFVMLGDLAYQAQQWLEATHWYHIASSVPIPRDHRLFIQSPLYSGPGGGRLALDKEAMSRWHLGDYAGALRCQKLVQEIRDDARVQKNISNFEKALAKQQAKEAESD